MFFVCTKWNLCSIALLPPHPIFTALELKCSTTFIQHLYFAKEHYTFHNAPKMQKHGVMQEKCLHLLKQPNYNMQKHTNRLYRL
jgi:hypothetical protein